MISYLRGRVIYLTEETLVLDVNGVGYEIYCSGGAFRKIGNSETANREILKVKSMIEKTGGEVEWYYFNNTISTEELLFELTAMKPHVNRIFGFCEDDAVFYVKGEKNGIK
jgi:Holliday junction resolvasome RuvABC DNA-binding subunit